MTLFDELLNVWENTTDTDNKLETSKLQELFIALKEGKDVRIRILDD